MFGFGGALPLGWGGINPKILCLVMVVPVTSY